MKFKVINPSFSKFPLCEWVDPISDNNFSLENFPYLHRSRPLDWYGVSEVPESGLRSVIYDLQALVRQGPGGPRPRATPLETTTAPLNSGVQDLIFLRPPKAVGNISHGRQNNGGRCRCDSIITLMMENDDFFN